MKKLLSLLVVCSMLFSLVACGGTSDNTGDKWLIGFSNKDDTDTYLKQVEDEFVKLVNADDTLSIIVADAGGDSQKQLDQLDNFTVQNIECVVLVPQDGATVNDYVAECNTKGIPVFCSSQSATEGEFTFVGASDYDMGLAQSVWAHDNLPANSKILYLGGALGYQTSIDRRQGLVDGLAERLQKDFNGNVINANGDIEVLSWQECMYSMEDGLTITEDWIQTFSDFNAILAVNDRSALGALEALQGANITDCYVIGIDGVEDAMQAIKDGTMAATVLQSTSAQAKALYDAVKVAQAGGTNPKTINPDVITIDSKNVNEYMK